jgi:hypothetical protein
MIQIDGFDLSGMDHAVSPDVERSHRGFSSAFIQQEKTSALPNCRHKSFPSPLLNCGMQLEYNG